MKISITQDHIDRGIRFNCSRCPAALAIIEATGREVEVSISWVWLHEKKYERAARRIRISPEVSQFMREFDVGLPVLPFDFELEME